MGGTLAQVSLKWQPIRCERHSERHRQRPSRVQAREALGGREPARAGLPHRVVAGADRREVVDAGTCAKCSSATTDSPTSPLNTGAPRDRLAARLKALVEAGDPRTSRILQLSGPLRLPPHPCRSRARAGHACAGQVGQQLGRGPAAGGAAAPSRPPPRLAREVASPAAKRSARREVTVRKLTPEWEMAEQCRTREQCWHPPASARARACRFRPLRGASCCTTSR